MSEKKRSGQSIAAQINFQWIADTLGCFILSDILIAVIAAAVWCIRTEQSIGGSFILNEPRTVRFIDGSLFYIFGNELVNADAFIENAKLLLICALCVQLFLLLIKAAGGGKRARKILRPIDELAISATDIASSELTPRNITVSLEKKPPAELHNMDFSDLQSAIDHTDPTAATHISTGNSDLKGLEDAVNSLLDRMRESYMRQAQFVSDASHELRTPIAVIQGYTNMLDRWGKTDEKVLDESIAALKSESDHIGRLVEQLLFLARSDNGRQTLNKDVFSISDMMKEVCGEYRLIDDTHAYLYDIQGDFMAYGDSSMIKQTVRILADNAKKYTPAGGEITLRVRRNVQGEVCFEVQDTGIGMEQSDIEHIFERFYRADPARNRDTGGTGLGLSIAKWIVDRHGGRFDISSCVGIGTRIAVVLPKINPDSADFILNDEKETKGSMSVMSVMMRK